MIIGPSHVVRWERLKNFLGVNADFYGVGGLPIWHEDVRLLSRSNDSFIMVGDFRFGNSYHLTQNKKDAFTVKKDLITSEIDRLMLERSEASLERLSGEKIRLVFWCLFIREYKNIESRKYFKNGVYEHPVWNLATLENKFENSIKLSTIIRQNLDFLFIDSSNHPSIFGYYFLKRIHQGASPTNALMSTLEAKKSFFNIFNVYKANKFIISGTTSTFRLIKDYLHRGIFEANQIGGFQVREADEALFSAHKYHQSIIYFAKEEDSKPHDEQLTFFDKAPYQHKLLIIKKNGKTFFYKSNNLEKPKPYFVMINDSEDEEIVGDIYNLIGLSQVIYFALALLSHEGTLYTNPYCALKKLLSSVHPAQ
nr:hypothetical protein [uncultured Pseudomonas sp.]